MGTVKPGTLAYENNAASLLETAPNLRRCAEHPPPATPPVPALLPPQHRSLPGPTPRTLRRAALLLLSKTMPRLVRVSLAISENFLLQRLTKGGFEICTAEYELSAFSSLAGCNWFGFKCFSELTSWVVNAKHSFRAVPRSPVRRLIFVTFCKPRLETTTRKPTRQHHQPASAQLGTAAPVPAPGHGDAGTAALLCPQPSHLLGAQRSQRGRGSAQTRGMAACSAADPVLDAALQSECLVKKK